MARVPGINKNTVINTLKKKEKTITQVNPDFHISAMGASILLTCEEVEIDEQWLFVEKNQTNAGFGIMCWASVIHKRLSVKI